MFVEKTQIEQLVGTKIKNLDLYQKAFTHKSALKEYKQFTESFETLEFIGDSVLGFVITKFLFDRYESRQEGFLTKARTKLVRGETLAKIASYLGLQNYIIMDEKGMRNGWNNNSNILEDAFEALIGAIYNIIMIDDNYKDHLMKYCQVNNMDLPEYRVVGQYEGLFYVDIFIQNACVSRGIAKNKKQAEQNGARMFFQVKDELINQEELKSNSP
jgi:ribonuclease-3